MKKDLFQGCFDSLEDPRSHINKLYSLNDILVVGIIAVICGAETIEGNGGVCQIKRSFFKNYTRTT